VQQVTELRSRCCTSHQIFDRSTTHLYDERLRESLDMRRLGLLATCPDGVVKYRVKLRGLKVRIIALHNTLRVAGFSGVAMPVWKLAERLKCSTSQYRACFRELVDAGVFSSMPFYVPMQFRNRHDVRRGDSPRCYSRSRRANVVVFAQVGLSLLRRRRFRGGDGSRGEPQLDSFSTPLLSDVLNSAVDKMCVATATTTVRKPEGNDRENFKTSYSRGVEKESSCGSTRLPSPAGDSLSQPASTHDVDVRMRRAVRPWLADKEE
jgi:hypothetical protein